jgi:mobilization protein NikA
MTRGTRHVREHQDAGAERGQPEPARRSERRRLAALVSVRFSPEEEALVRDVARQRGQSLSGFVRQAALREAAPRTSVPPLVGGQSTTTATQTWSVYESATIRIVGPQLGAVVREIGTR